MSRHNLSIPFVVPLLGEGFISLGNPLLTAALDFSMNVTMSGPGSGDLDVPINSKPLKRIVSKYLASQGIAGKFSIDSPATRADDRDFVNIASLLYLTNSDGVGSGILPLVDRTDDHDFITMVRALNALSGGFVVSRRGEGLISLDGMIEASIILRIGSGGRRVRRFLGDFSAAFPGLAPPLWHMLGHLVLEGGNAIRNGDAEALGRLMYIESCTQLAVGLIGIQELRRCANMKSCYGGKVICSDAMVGELILAPEETTPMDSLEHFHFSPEGVSEIDQG